ncbi:MAG: hypothetical protein IT336_01670, partial [Thermomicrobiales bacterium]|nr:hypothetical protein [Thermomicrobiales bacterium]
MPPREPRNNSPMALVAAVTLLVIVSAIVAWIIFGSIGSNDDQTITSASPTTASQIAIAATPEASPTSSPAPTQPSTTPTPQSEARTTPAATAARTPAPTPQVTPTTVPRTQPAVGDFGDLPPGDVPSGTSVQRPLSLDYAL